MSDSPRRKRPLCPVPLLPAEKATLLRAAGTTPLATWIRDTALLGAKAAAAGLDLSELILAALRRG